MELDHVGIAVTSLDGALARWLPITGAPSGPAEEVSGGVRVLFLAAGGVPIELLEPTRPDSVISRFLQNRGDGVHHLAYRVPSVDRALADVVQRGGRVIDRTGRPGARGHRVGFAHPSAFGGVLVEFVESP